MLRVTIAVYMLATIMFSACTTNSRECNISDNDLYLASEYTKIASAIYSNGDDSIGLAISYIDSAIILNPSESNYTLKWQYCMKAGDRDGALSAIDGYWHICDEGYAMAISTGLMYDIDNMKDSAVIFYLKAKKRLSRIRDNHDDIYYKLDQKYIDILINGETNCIEYIDLLTAREDSIYLNYMINYIDTLTINTIKTSITR